MFNLRGLGQQQSAQDPHTPPHNAYLDPMDIPDSSGPSPDLTPSSSPRGRGFHIPLPHFRGHDHNNNNHDHAHEHDHEAGAEQHHTPLGKLAPHGIISGVIHDFAHSSETKQLLLSPSKSKLRKRRKREISSSAPSPVVAPEGVAVELEDADAWMYPGWGSATTDEIDVSKAPKEPNRKILGLWMSTSIAGNDLLASVLYTIGVTTVEAGPLAPISLLLVAVFLYPYRWIYSEVGSALPLNGGSYNCLLNATNKPFATIAACLSLLSYTATAVVSAASATAYLSGEVGGFDVFWPTLGILLTITILVIFGIRDSAIVATIMFTTHTVVLTILIFASIVKVGQNGGDMFKFNYHNWNFDNPIRDIYFGFSVALLGITGFETASNYIEEIKPGVFPKTMNLMWVLVTVYNPIIGLLAVGVVPVQEIRSSPANGLSIVAGAAGGHWLRMLVAVDAAFVLCGGVLTGFVGVGGLIKRLAEDDCLPSFILHRNRWTHTYHLITFCFFVLTASLYAIVDGDITSLSGVFAVSFLSVMCMFAVGNLILKFKRPMLPRTTIAPWYWVVFGLSGMAAGLIGNLVLDPMILAYFAIYFVVIMFVVRVTLSRGLLAKLCLVAVQSIPFLNRYEKRMLDMLLRMRQRSVIFFTKSDKIHVLNKAVMYAHNNELCDHIKLIHIYDNEANIPSQLKENHYIIDHMYPKIKIDLVVIQGVFSPETVRMISERYKVPLSYMFIQCPAKDFPYNIGDFGGVRTIMR